MKTTRFQHFKARALKDPDVGRAYEEGLEDLRIAVRLAELREQRGMTQTELARRLGISLWTVEQLELGRGDFTAHERGITDATGTEPSWFREAIPTSEPAAAALK